MDPSRIRILIRIATLVRRALAGTCTVPVLLVQFVKTLPVAPIVAWGRDRPTPLLSYAYELR